MKINYLPLVVTTFLAGIQLSNAQSGGNGTSGNPYQIKTCDDLQAMSNYPNAYWILMNDVDCMATKTGTGEWNAAGFVPVGDSAVRFAGNFNGQCYSIDNLYINRPTTNYVGLFGFTDSSAYITNVEILNADITGDNNTGIAIGYKRSTYFDDCMTSGSVNGSNYTGGVVGCSDNYQGTGAEITNCSSQATVKGTNFTGGVVGKITTFQGGASYLVNCFSTGSVTGNNSTGGIAGSCGTYQGGGAELQYCYATGTVRGNDSVGGLVGNMGPIMGGGSYIIQSYSKDSVIGKTDVGGLAGFNGPNSGGASAVYNSYSQSTVTGTTNVGGAVGYEIATGAGWGIDTCYSTGKVTGTTNVGGLLGNQSNAASFATNYWDSIVNPTLKSVGNLGSVAGVTPSSTLQMQTLATYLSWNFTTIWSYTASSFPTLDPSPSGGSCNFPNTLSAVFSYSPDSTCAGDTVYFKDATMGSPTAWSWNFGDPSSGPNNTSALQNPKHVFSGVGSFTVTLVASKGAAKDTATTIVNINCSVLGVATLSNTASISVYPNPGNGHFTFVINNVSSSAPFIEVYNMLGEKIMNSELNTGKTEINISSEPQGVYFYRILSHTGSLITNGKLVIE